MPGSILGNAVRRVEDPELLRGEGTFVDNLRLDGALYAAFVRSPFAHARVAAIEVAEAREAPGVVAVFTAADLDLPPTPVFAIANEACGHPPLATDRVRYVGDPVAVVLAESAAAAADAVPLVDVDYDPLPAVVDVEAAVAEGAPLQFEELGSNVATGERDGGDDDPLEGADVVVRARMVNQRVAVAPIETNAIAVDPTGDVLTIHHSTQMPHTSRNLVAAWLGLERSQVRVIAPHVGGAFGGKVGLTPEQWTVVASARQLGRPVKWTETRSEAMLSMHGRGQVQYAELGLTSDGLITGLRCRVLGDCGAYAGFSGEFPQGPTFFMSQGVYEIPRVSFDGVAVMTNTTPVGAFRGAGRPEAAAMLERLMDLAADETGISPVEIRRRNFIRSDRFPYATRTGALYDNGDFDLPLREALRIANYEGLLAEQDGRRQRGDVLQLGIGVSAYVEVTGGGSGEFGSVEVHEDGTATVMAGTSAHGQGHATSFSMIVADRLGIPLDRIRYVQSDTALVPSGWGTGGSRSLQLGGTAVGQAADAVLVRARDVAAALLEAAPPDVSLTEEGMFHVAGVPGVMVTWADVATQATTDGGAPLQAGLKFKAEGATFPFGAHVSVVEVDTETGQVTPLWHVAVDDCGTVLNPLIVAGQQHGGAAQGISQALWEEFLYDPDGTPMTSTFADYGIPSAADLPPLAASNTETPTPLNPLGAKGIGESATIGSTPAVQNAVVDALSHLGVRHVDLPCTPGRVWAAMQAAARGEADPWREPPDVFASLPVRSADLDGEVAETI